MTFETFDIAGTDGVRLHGCVGGPADAPLILFVHGFPDCHRTWSLQLEVLSERYRVAAFDLRGAGHSTPPGSASDYRIERVLTDFDAVLDHVAGPQGRAHLVSHDWGSALSWCFLADPERQARILSFTSISGPHPGMMWDWLGARFGSLSLKGWREGIEQFTHSWYIFAFLIPGLAERLFNAFDGALWRRELRKAGVPDHDPLLAETPARIRSMTTHTLGLYRANALHAPRPPAPGSYALPVQLLVPLNDSFVRPAVLSEVDRYCTRLQRHEVAANHWVQRSHPDWLNQTLQNFIREH